MSKIVGFIGNPDLKRKIGNPDLARRMGFGMPYADAIRIRDHVVRYGVPVPALGSAHPLTDCVVYPVSGYGAAVDDIQCPVGTTPGGDAAGNVWCVDGSGSTIAASFVPATGVGAPSALGVVGWGVVIAGALFLGAVVVSK
jgi:hypothetical protein